MDLGLIWEPGLTEKHQVRIKFSYNDLKIRYFISQSGWVTIKKFESRKVIRFKLFWFNSGHIDVIW